MPTSGSTFMHRLADDVGRVHPAYALLPHSRPGDIIFHYQQPDGIVAWSRVAGEAFEDRIVWGARGRAAQRAGVRPYERSGWRVPLDGPFILARKVSLAELRQREGAIRNAIESTERELLAPSMAHFSSPTDSHYGLPRITSQNFRLQSYLEVPELLRAADEAGNRGTDRFAPPPTTLRAPESPELLGQRYVDAHQNAATSRRNPLSIDPAAVERGVRGHAATQKHFG